MLNFDLLVRNGTVATAADTFAADVAVKDGRIVALGEDLGNGVHEIDAKGKLVLPGGVEGHCHIEQISSNGVMTADDFYSGTVSAVFGGTTTVIPFAAQQRGESIRQVVENYHACAGPKAVIDYGFHLIISDPTDQVIGQELPALTKDGYTSFKVYMTYDDLRLDDYQMLQVLSAARREGAMVMVHAENHDMIRWLSEKLLDGGNWQPQYHAVSHSRTGEGEAASPLGASGAAHHGPAASLASPMGREQRFALSGRTGTSRCRGSRRKRTGWTGPSVVETNSQF